MPEIEYRVKNVELALANLLYHFDWKLRNGMKEEDLDIEENLGLSSHPPQKVASQACTNFIPSMSSFMAETNNGYFYM